MSTVAVPTVRPETRAVVERVSEWRPELGTRKVPVTGYREVTEVATHCVPPQVAVQVPCQETVCVPVFASCP